MGEGGAQRYEAARGSNLGAMAACADRAVLARARLRRACRDCDQARAQLPSRADSAVRTACAPPSAPDASPAADDAPPSAAAAAVAPRA